MLNHDALAQLRGLKDQIESEKEHAEGVLRGTAARYGFVKLDDGREVFVPPDEMLKGFHGDRVRVCVQPGKDKRLVAEIEGLVESALQEFTGRCVSKGKAMFVQPDLVDMQRWLFLPPQNRKGVADGDYLRCAVQRHPIRDGKPQARVIERIGAPGDAGIENRYTMARHGLQATWPEDESAAVEQLLQTRDPLSDETRTDLSDLPFVSIDAARTLDIDDALYAEVTSEGWILYVAIADPTAYIDAQSPLRELLRHRASSVYFHGAAVPMLPESIAQKRCALAEDELRPALICRLAVAEDGNVGDFSFCEGKVRSRAKLSYYAVDRYLAGQDDSLICHATPLEALYQVSRALRTRRETMELVMEERTDYRWILNDQGHIDHVEPSEKLLSQRLVEECMVAANRCAARLLAENEASGPFVVHDGFRGDKRKDREKFVSLYVAELKDADLDSLGGYRGLIKCLNNSKHELPLRSMVNRLLTRARFSKRPGQHMGMSLALYTNCTSPLRRYLDFVVHLQIKAILHQQEPTGCDQPELDALNQRLQRLRRVSLEAERWLTLEYLQRLQQSSPGPWAARVVHLGNTGFTVRLEENGLEGYVDLRRSPEKFSFEKWTATLHSRTRQFRVELPVQVTLVGADEESLHLPLFELAAASGLKAKKSGRKSKAASSAAVQNPDESAQIAQPELPETAAAEILPETAAAEAVVADVPGPEEAIPAQMCDPAPPTAQDIEGDGGSESSTTPGISEVAEPATAVEPPKTS
ncbi:MAG: VacB/RNase II family 3'-5' exoribonuclease [Halieaceae bacterium]|jgi:VacB/RNase II family 3'-5' exoribonuclease